MKDTTAGKGAKAMKTRIEEAKKCHICGVWKYDLRKHLAEIHNYECELCNGTGYFKTNTGEYEGDCPNGCAEVIIKALRDAKEKLSKVA